mmetsp:Transcript_10580/g.32521  ORF Transcript_10580/g.32521 Transcript_10580/m.32521 type:complete len:89 (-) Transcript_10580:284-550(-)
MSITYCIALQKVTCMCRPFMKRSRIAKLLSTFLSYMQSSISTNMLHWCRIRESTLVRLRSSLFSSSFGIYRYNSLFSLILGQKLRLDA